MFSSSPPSASPRRLPGGRAASNADELATLRVMPATGDPTDEVRASLAGLTARAQRLVSDQDSETLLRNGFGLFEASRKAAEEARQQASKCQSTSEGYAPATHASVELFMTQHLGFDAQAQRRLLQQLQRRQSQLGADLGPTEPMAGTEAATFVGVTDVDAVVAELKNDILLDVHNSVHRRQTSLVRDQVDTLFKAAWHPYYVRVADDYEALAIGSAQLLANKSGGRGSASTTRPLSAGASGAAGLAAGSTGHLAELLRGDSAIAAELNHRIAAFAAIVQEYPPLQWISQFNAYVAESSLEVVDELSVLWASVMEILMPMQQRGAEADTLAYVGVSRRVMERKSLRRLLERVLRLDPARFEEVESMNAEHVLDVVMRYCGTANRWMHAFVAMRVGRYDVARLAVQALGISAVADAMEKVAAAAPTARNALAPATSLQDLYAEAATREDPYRQAVLLLLLAGRTGEPTATVLRSMLSLAQRVTDSLEDALWLRLSCIRGTEESQEVAPVQSLSTLQRAVLDDMLGLVALTQGSPCRLASFAIHALLPSTGLRVLLENKHTYVDGFHMALCFNVQNLLQSSGVQAPLVEVPIDLGRHMTRYCSVVLLETDRRTRAGVFAGTAVFPYFYKNGLTEAFVECCLKDAMCARLLGSRNAAGMQDALLLRLGTGPLSEELMKALIKAAETASSRSEIAKATHIFLAVTFMAEQLQRPQLRRQALRCAVQLNIPTLAQVLHLPPNSPVVFDVFSQAAQLRQVLQADPDLVYSDAVAAQEYDVFAQLCRMADVYAYNLNGNASDAVTEFFRLPFVPGPSSAATADVSAYVDAYCNAPGSVQLGARAILPIAVSAAEKLLELYAQSRSNDGSAEEKQFRLLQRMRVVCEWARQCCVRTSVELPVVVGDFESSHLF